MVPLWLESSTLLHLLWSALLCSRKTNLVLHLWLQLGKCSLPPLMERDSALKHKDVDLYEQKSLPLVSNWSVLMQMRTINPHRFIEDIAAQLQLDGGKPQSYCLKQSSKNSFRRTDSDGRNTVQENSWVQEAGSLMQGSPWSAVCMRVSCLEMPAKLCFLNWAE